MISENLSTMVLFIIFMREKSCIKNILLKILKQEVIL